MPHDRLAGFGESNSALHPVQPCGILLTFMTTASDKSFEKNKSARRFFTGMKDEPFPRLSYIQMHNDLGYFIVVEGQAYFIGGVP